jgi:PAS domain S-box-containing protein
MTSGAVPVIEGQSLETIPPHVPYGGISLGESEFVEMSPRLLAELLDLAAWREILTTFGRSMRVAVALTDCRGCVLGEFHNAQPVWTLIHEAVPVWSTGCAFCITKGPPCNALTQSLQSGLAVTVTDQAGLSHVAIPLVLGKQRLGTIIAGQVFDRYPDPLSLRRVAKEFGVSAQTLWEVASSQCPVGRHVLQSLGELLHALGHAFLQQRYGAIVKANLADTNRRFRLLVEGVKDHALFTMDPEGSVTGWNAGATHLLGYSEAEITGQSFSRIFTPEDVRSGLPERLLQEAFKVGRTEDEGWRLPRNGNQFWAAVSITALLDDAGRVGSFGVILQDVTNRKKVATELEAARLERERSQEELLSHVSHELRTPLTAIYLFTTNVLDGLLGEVTPEQHEHLTFALDNISQLKSMVSDLLDLSRVDAHKLTAIPQRVSLVRLIADVLGTCSTNATEKGVNLLADVSPDLAFAWADPVRVRQVLTNLIDNGIKFTPRGGNVTVECQLLTEDEAFLCLSVTDTGCGISAENRERVFERLAQVKNGMESSRSGLGLGLFISKGLVSQQGGRIWVDSQLGHGSIFRFTLPVFSLARLCAPIFPEPNLDACPVSLIAVDFNTVQAVEQLKLPTEIPQVIQRCIRPHHDLLLPFMNDAGTGKTFFIVACADVAGSEVIAKRIGKQLKTSGHISQPQPIISSTTLLPISGLPRMKQIGEVAGRMNHLVQAHTLDKTS